MGSTDGKPDGSQSETILTSGSRYDIERGPTQNTVYPYGLDPEREYRAYVRCEPGSAKYADPTPLGCFALGTSWFLVCMTVVNAGHVAHPNLFMGVLIFLGGISQIIAGIWAFAVKDLFGATLYCTFSAFYIQFAMLYIPATGILEAYTVDGELTDEFSQALAIYIWMYVVLVLFFVLGAIRTNILLLTTLILAWLCLVLIAAGYHLGQHATIIAGGWVGLVVGVMVWAVGFISFFGSMTGIIIPIPSLAPKVKNE